MVRTPNQSSQSNDSSKANGPAADILYIEDDEASWKAAHGSLRTRYRLTWARNAKEAFALLQAHTYDLILMNIELADSDLDGIQIAQILTGRYSGNAPGYASAVRSKGAKIIFVTGYSAKYSKQTLMQAGGDELILKPVDFTRLSLAVARLLVKSAGQSGD